MKSNNRLSLRIKNLSILLLMLLFQTSVWAQDSGDAGVSVKITKDSGGGWYTQPWVWIAGGAVFILLLVALLRGNNNKN